MQKTVAVIDGNSLMHRAYHAIQTPMEAKDGTPTNAVFGFMQMFCKFVEETAPDAVICAFDEGKPTHRLADLPEYKAQRPHMDDELRVQFPVIEELLDSMNVPVVKCPGWEGDDVLGTIAARDEKLGYRTLLVTGDKDACQLASPLTSIVNTKKGISDVVVLDPEGVLEKYGVAPEQFTDYLGLMGDSSDNIPGVPGIGPKTATTMLQKYGDMEGVYAHIDDFKGKQKEKLEQNRDLAFLSRQIATIVCDLDFELDLEDASFPDFEPAQVQEAFQKYMLMSPLTRVLRLVDEEPEPAKAEMEVPAIVPASDAVGLLSEAAKAGETVGVAFAEGEQGTIFGPLVSAAFSTPSGCAVLEGDEALDALAGIMASGKVACLDVSQAMRLVWPPDNDVPARIERDALFAADVFDVGLAGYLLDSSKSSYTCESLAMEYLGGRLPEPEDDEGRLAVDATACRLLAPKLREALESDGSLGVYDDIDAPLVPVLVAMERTGVELDFERLAGLGRSSAAELEGLATKIYGMAGEEFNIDSPKQLGHILFEKMGLEPIKKNQRGFSTDATVMRELAKTQEIAGLVLAYREVSKIKRTYIDTLPKMRAGDGRVHTVFHQTVTATGRLSSSDPNLQNIPVRTDFGRQIRECFVPLREGDVFMSADYSQIELRLLAHMSQDEHLVAAFNSGADFHAMTASRVFGVPVDEVTPQMRSRSKAVNFGIVYGQQAFGLAQTLDIPRQEAKDMIDRYFDAYPGVRKYLDGIVEGARESGYAESLYGRKRRIPELRAKNRQVAGVGERTAMNHPLQGTAADIIKIAMIQVERGLREGGFAAKLLLQVHDELDLSVPEGEVDAVTQLVRDAMQGVAKLDVPLLVDVSCGSNWAEAH